MSSVYKREYWQRSLDLYFRVIEGRRGRVRDPEELEQEIANGVEGLRNEINAFGEKFQQDVDMYIERLNKSTEGSSPLWTPLPTWMSWKKKKRPIECMQILEREKKIIDGRMVRGGFVPGGGRVHTTMKEKLAKTGETGMSRRRDNMLRNSSRTESEGWIPGVAGRFDTEKPANREASLSGWERVEKSLGRANLRGTRVP